MRTAPATAALLGALLAALLAGCYESLEFGALPEGAGGQPPEFDWSRLDPPDNIDVATCSDLVLGSATISECTACCELAGFPAASFIGDEHCTCGNTREDDRDDACAGTANERGPTVAECDACCDLAGYLGFAWNGEGGFYTTCTCEGVEDGSLCSDTLDDEMPEDACHYCCLENGLVSATFQPQQCECSGP